MVALQQLINGLMLGSTYSLIAVGYSLVFGLLQMLNLAHGEVYMFSAFVGWFLVASLNLPFMLAFLVAILAAGLIGIIIEFFCFRLVKKEYPLASLLSTIGFGIILQNFALVFSGGEMVRFPQTFKNIDFTLGPIVISGLHLAILAIAIALMLLLQLMIHKTKLGKSLRAVASNRRVAGMYGINVNATTSLAFFISAAIAGVAGILTALAYHSITPFMGVDMGLKGLTVIVLGGMTSIAGAMIGGLILGIGEVAAMAYLPMDYIGYKDGIAFVILILVLLLKPSGLMGKVVEEKV